MNRKKEKPYLEFGGNAFYIELNSILETIKIDSLPESNPPEPKVEEKPGKKLKVKKLVEPEPINEEEILDVMSEMTGAVQIDISKWEILKLMLEVIMTNQSEVDDKLGMTGLNNGTSIPFKIAFNTLLKYDILKEEEE